ncbi:hypothetical protein CFP66_41545 [Pseudonocardia sp. MH-G8]|nr:hypothetical protein CFP66_41545 [Pseudonocardia sp. MH-G8]
MGGWASPLSLSYAQLLELGPVEFDAAMVCIHNRLGWSRVGNARWTGVPLRRILDAARPHGGAAVLVSRAVDGWECGIPLELLDELDGYVVVGMGGRALTAAHEFPARGVLGAVLRREVAHRAAVASGTQPGLLAPAGVAARTEPASCNWLWRVPSRRVPSRWRTVDAPWTLLADLRCAHVGKAPASTPGPTQTPCPVSGCARRGVFAARPRRRSATRPPCSAGPAAPVRAPRRRAPARSRRPPRARAVRSVA